MMATQQGGKHENQQQGKWSKLPFTDLLSVTTMTLATSGDEGPHATPVYYVDGDEFRLYFFSDVNSLHGQHVLGNPQAAAAIYPECDGWQDIRGLQLRGVVRLVESPEEWNAAWGRYQGKFPFTRSLKTVVAQNQLYVFIPNWIRLVDNSKGFGYKREWNLEDG
jgi:uncharacterized protein YhbP (UPF0306 family)